MNIMKITDPAFAKYGKVIDSVDLSDLLAIMAKEPFNEDVYYTPSYAPLENTAAYKELTEQIYGGMPIQLGVCNGKNHKLNALEYHRDSELDIGYTDSILLLGCQQDIDPADFSYDTSKVEAFLLPKGAMVELYATTLHYAPISVGDNYFGTIVALPRGTNTDLTFTPASEGEAKLLTNTNKWLIAHPEAGIEGAYCGLKGENITI